MKTKTYITNFDFDDNLIFMPTSIILFAKKVETIPQELSISTQDFANYRKLIGSNCVYNDANGRSYNLADYELRGDLSYREFRDCSKNYFLTHLKIAIKNNAFGPSFKDFQKFCSTQESANHLSIITARGQSSKTLHAGLKLFQKMKLIKYVPPVENMYALSEPDSLLKIKYKDLDVSDTKGHILVDILMKAIKDNKYVSFGFSDDDNHTIEKVIQILSNRIHELDLDYVHKISIYNTSSNRKVPYVVKPQKKTA